MRGGGARRSDVTGKVAFFGCSHDGQARLVRVGLAGEGKPPRGATLDCPVCGTRHEVSLQWRQPVAADEDREPELVVSGQVGVGGGDRGEGAASVSGQRPMPSQARRSGLEALRAVLRRRNPGFDVIFAEVERSNLIDDATAGEVGGGLPAPEDADAALNRVNVSPPAAGLADENAVEEAGENLPPVVGGEG